MGTALLIIDIQNDYFDGGANPLVDSEKACINARLILDAFREDGMPVIFVQHISNRPDSTFFLPCTPGVEIHRVLTPLDNEMVITKNYPNSFKNTDLLEYLRANEIHNLIICGMMTHLCIDSTVRAAKDLGFNCTLIGDACATKNLEINGQLVIAEVIQNSFFAALNGFYAMVIKAEEYLGGE
jgi:nicotinamidase-related amidase